MVQLPKGIAGRVTELRKLARRNVTIGQIAAAMDVLPSDVRTAVDLLGLVVIRSDGERPKTRLAYRESASAYTAQLRAVKVAIQEHKSRLAAAPPLTPAQEQAAIDRFLAEKGVTKCPTVRVEGSDGGDSVPVMPIQTDE